VSRAASPAIPQGQIGRRSVEARRLDARPTTMSTALSTVSPGVLTVLLLVLSNVFMTFAWYGHLKFKSRALWLVIMVSWGIAFFEYCLQVPANRLGHAVYSAPQLKGLQEILTLLVFAGFSTWYLGESIRWNHVAAFALIVVAAFLLFLD
jgi:uncharacterized protein (DUF486 family)